MACVTWWPRSPVLRQRPASGRTHIPHVCSTCMSLGCVCVWKTKLWSPELTQCPSGGLGECLKPPVEGDVCACAQARTAGLTTWPAESGAHPGLKLPSWPHVDQPPASPDTPGGPPASLTGVPHSPRPSGSPLLHLRGTPLPPTPKPTVGVTPVRARPGGQGGRTFPRRPLFSSHAECVWGNMGAQDAGEMVRAGPDPPSPPHPHHHPPCQARAQPQEPPVPGSGSGSGLGTTRSGPAAARARRGLSPPRPHSAPPPGSPPSA